MKILNNYIYRVGNKKVFECKAEDINEADWYFEQSVSADILRHSIWRQEQIYEPDNKTDKPNYNSYDYYKPKHSAGRDILFSVLILFAAVIVIAVMNNYILR
jgi:hypothetical protein